MQNLEPLKAYLCILIQLRGPSNLPSVLVYGFWLQFIDRLALGLYRYGVYQCLWCRV